MGNSPSSVPYGTSINLVNATLICTQQYAGVNNTRSYNMPFTFSVTAPLKGDMFGGDTYFHDIAASFNLPYSFYSTAGEGSSTYNYTAEAVLSVGDANPNNFTISAAGVRRFDDEVLNIPADRSQVLGASGPVRFFAADGMKITNLVFSSVRVTAYPVGSSPLTITCGANLNPYVLASVTSDTSQNIEASTGNGFTANFPLTLNGQKTTIINTPVICNNYDAPGFNYTVGGTGPAVIIGTSPISLTNFQNYFTVNGDIVRGESTKYGPGTYRLTYSSGKNTSGDDLTGPAINTFLGGVSTDVSNVNYKTVDMSRDFTPTDSNNARPLSVARNVEYNTSTPVTFPLPLDGSLTYSVVPYTQGFFTVAVYGIQGSLISETQGVARSIDANLICTTPGYTFLSAPIFTG